MSTDAPRQPQPTPRLAAMEQQLHERIVAATAARREPRLAPRRPSEPR